MSFIQDEFTLYTDASGVLGFGAVYKSHWFSLSWPQSVIHHNINFKELFAIIAAVHTWSDQWAHMQITFMTDNSPICDILCKGSTPDRDIICLVQHLFFHAAKINLNIVFQHVPGQYNVMADLLSHRQVDRFLQQFPLMDRAPASVPAVIWAIYSD